MTDLNQLELDLINAIGSADGVQALEDLRVSALGKSGSISGLLKGLGAMSPDERRTEGPRINGLRDRVASALSARKAELEAAELQGRLKSEHLDLTLPSRPARTGSVHPTLQVMDEMVALFADMGFSVAEGPDIEDDFHNFSGREMRSNVSVAVAEHNAITALAMSAATIAVSDNFYEVAFFKFCFH